MLLMLRQLVASSGERKTAKANFAPGVKRTSVIGDPGPTTSLTCVPPTHRHTDMHRVRTCV